jgi:branched-chain amino acid transport system permease protein
MNLFQKRKKSYLINTVATIILFIVFQTLVSSGLLSGYVSTILVFICINIVMATSLNLATGILGQLALGHAGFMAIGAYISAITAMSLKGSMPEVFVFMVALLIGGAFAGLVGILIGTPALRLKGDYLGILTLGFGEIIKVVIINLDITGGAQGLVGIPRFSNFTNVFIVTVIVVVVINTLLRSRHGRAILSIREDEIAAEAVGIKTTKYKVLAFSISAALGGIGGGLYAFQLAFLAPQVFGFLKSVDILVIVVLGGMGSITGSIVAAVVLTVLPESLRDFEQYRLLVYSGLLVIMMIFRPQGLFGKKEFSLKVAIRHLRTRLNLKELAEGSE